MARMGAPRLLWTGLMAAALLAMYASAACTEVRARPVKRKVSVTKTSHKFTLYWQAVSRDAGLFTLLPPSNATSDRDSNFGQVQAFDGGITTLQDSKSKTVGRGKGVITFESLNSSGEMTRWNAYFRRDMHLGGLKVKKGSALFYTGFHYTAASNNQTGFEIAVVGGTGSFRFCHGYESEILGHVTVGLHHHIICDSF